jgi:hypothetical protein
VAHLLLMQVGSAICKSSKRVLVRTIPMKKATLCHSSPSQFFESFFFFFFSLVSHLSFSSAFRLALLLSTMVLTLPLSFFLRLCCRYLSQEEINQLIYGNLGDLMHRLCLHPFFCFFASCFSFFHFSFFPFCFISSFLFFSPYPTAPLETPGTKVLGPLTAFFDKIGDKFRSFPAEGARRA